MPFNLDLPTFAGGEISPSVASRYDTAKYHTALMRSRNCLGAPEGGAYRRPGFNFAGLVKAQARRTRVIPFQFSVEQGYAVELGHHTLRIFYQGGLIVRPPLTITAINQSNPAQIAAPDHGYVVGQDVYFSGILGMVEMNGLVGRILAVLDANNFTVDIDAVGFSDFTGDTGGVLGGSLGGEGGYPPPDPDPQPPPFQNTEPPPFVIDPGGYDGFGYGGFIIFP